MQKYSKIWDKTRNLFKEKFSSEPVYNDSYNKTKISSNNISIYSNRMSKENECYTILSVILLESIINCRWKIFIHKCF